MSAEMAFGWQKRTPGAAATPLWIISPELLRYTFLPEIMYPASGSSRQLTAGFELRFSKDSLFCYLPYSGRAYSAAHVSRDETLNFSTTDFDFIPGKIKKQERTFVLKLKDRPEINEISITLYRDGYADVQVIFNQRQNIAYRGQMITEKRL